MTESNPTSSAASLELTSTPEPTGKPTFADATSDLVNQMTEGNFDGVTQYATTHLAPALMSAGVGLFVIFIGYLVAKYLMRVISRPVCRRVDETLGKFVGKMVFYSIMSAVVGAVLTKLGAPLGGLAAMLAAAGFAVGLAFQGTLSNFASGVLMLVFRPFKVGDVVTAAGVTGKVDEIDLFTTTLDTPDNRRIIVPNSSIASGTIENISHHKHRRVEVLVGVDYSADLQATREALQTALNQLAANIIPGDNRGSAVVLAGLGDSAVNWKVRMWVAGSQFWPMTEALTAEVKNQLDAANIGIPFPQMDIHVHQFADAVAQKERANRTRPTRRASERMAG
ncbi:mechanosensitive ion channel family protein [Rhodopirellula sp. JC740]|uniref:Mechanosensitive ion channel family protein n=1 Tax=Rhodopirellula halodulae TaxID=2894198 RepID=A0ABS8NED0_9BACT|nr:mechanosensitive ion channel family protein [Rhodopirellula sp. JC740]MCC9641905.1 mechanosensitive ion channel family protein [Rhodopirellula sp. JC740]